MASYLLYLHYINPRYRRGRPGIAAFGSNRGCRYV